jgi:hypothetical protein
MLIPSKIKVIVVMGAQPGGSTTYLEMARKLGATKAFFKPID